MLSIASRLDLGERGYAGSEPAHFSCNSTDCGAGLSIRVTLYTGGLLGRPDSESGLRVARLVRFDGVTFKNTQKAVS